VGAQAARLVERTLDRVSEAAVLVEAPGRVVRGNSAGRIALGARGLPIDVHAALGVGWSALRDAALAQASAGFALPRFGSHGPGRARLEPLLGADGALLAVAVFRDPPRRAPVVLAETAPTPDPFASVYAEDPATRAVLDLGRRVAASDLPIVLLAETGAGKERVAEALHAASRRRDGPFVAVNCGSFAPELLAAELFGYGPGAFTGADRAGRDGLLSAAAGGTLFLDEIGDMPASMQVALLRVLEDGRYERVGERAPRRADVRVLCATSRDLPAMVEAGSFRRDLWFRLKGVVLRLPPLRDRADRLGLARHLLARASDPDAAPEIGEDFAAFIESYGWPGNVRELRSVLEVARVLADGAPCLEIAHLPPDLAPAPSPPSGDVADGSLDAVQVWAIRRAVDACAGNVSAAARKLGIARSTIYRVLQRGLGPHG
jgi:transcriptional regulator of acetoin/glycerol metabolism